MPGKRGIEDREVYDGDKVKKVSGLGRGGEHPCGKQCCQYQKVGLHGKVRLAGMGLCICRESISGHYKRNFVGTEREDIGLVWRECTRMSLRDSVLW